MFVVASGFTLIFGLMRTVNMAHGALFLLAAYIAIEMQERMVGKTRNIEPADVSVASWVVPMLVGAASPRSSASSSSRCSCVGTRVKTSARR